VGFSRLREAVLLYIFQPFNPEGWAGLGYIYRIEVRYGWVVVREEGRREEGKEVWDEVLFGGGGVGGGRKNLFYFG